MQTETKDRVSGGSRRSEAYAPADLRWEAVLIGRIAAGDATALDDFYKHFRSRILATARQMVNDEWDAEEVLQDVVWTVFRKVHTFRGEGELWTWVHRVTQNAARMLMRKRRRAPTPIEESDVESMMQSSPEAYASIRPEEVAMQRFAIEKVAEELGRLDPTNQELFQAMEIDGATKEDVANQLNLSVSAVKARLHRVRRALRSAAASAGAELPAEMPMAV